MSLPAATRRSCGCRAHCIAAGAEPVALRLLSQAAGLPGVKMTPRACEITLFKVRAAYVRLESARGLRSATESPVGCRVAVDEATLEGSTLCAHVTACWVAPTALAGPLGVT
eukprot:GHRQ01016046.1.p1 GENE.GHRQ01016046.1~~GHRQ01016046.1.p1  ORF type:complete len:112 (-),score=8.97 GHRQ01016046.1:326-661(-)